MKNENGGGGAPMGEMEEMTNIEKSGSSLPWGVYVPPYSGNNGDEMTLTHCEDKKRAKVPIEQMNGGGYVRMVDSKGKGYPCAFVQPIGSKMKTIVRKKRKRLQLPDDNKLTNGSNDTDTCDKDTPLTTKDETETIHQKVTITEERLHPEEALFLHMRGLLRIESISKKGDDDNMECESKTTNSILSTQDLFCTMLPECKVPLAAYLAYAHLRAQGYILIRYTEQRMNLLRRLKEQQRLNEQRTKELQEREEQQKLNRTKELEEKPLQKDDLNSLAASPKAEHVEENSESMKEENPINDECEAPSQDDKAEDGDDNTSVTSSNSRPKIKPLRSQLSDDVATASPPVVVSLQSDGNTEKQKKSLAYYAYNPNARFKRSNPGLPDFGVAVVPFQSGDGNGVTFNTLNSLVSMCEGEEHKEDTHKNHDDARSDIPLRVVTVADGGVVIAFGVTNGDVPSINHAKTSV